MEFKVRKFSRSVIALAVLAIAFFVVPTRVHERYLFGAVAIGLLLLPRGRGWWAWCSCCR
mgnify:CR=1 FL=1